MNRWDEIKHGNRTPREIARRTAAAQRARREGIDLATLRALCDVTQVDLAARLDMAQSVISRIERQADWRVSTLHRYIRALGGQLRLVAEFGSQQAPLRLPQRRTGRRKTDSAPR